MQLDFTSTVKTESKNYSLLSLSPVTWLEWFPVFSVLVWLTSEFGGQGLDWEGLPHAQALLPVDEEGVGLDLDVVLQPGLVPEEVLVGSLGLGQLPVQQVDTLLQLAHLGGGTAQYTLHAAQG